MANSQRYWVHSQPADLGEEPVVHECARGDRCAERTVAIVDGKRVVQPALVPRAFCDSDRDYIGTCIDAIPTLYVELYLRLGDKGRAGFDGPRVTMARSAPLPIRADIHDLMVRVVNVVESWGERVRDVADLSGPGTEESRHRRDGVAVSTTCRTLTAHLDVLLSLPRLPMCRFVPEASVGALGDDVDGWVRPAGWAVVSVEMGAAEAGLEILDLHRACRSKLGWTPRHHDLKTACWREECGMRMLRRWDGATGLEDHVVCRACGEEYLGERLRLLMIQEEAIQQVRATKQAS